MSAEINNNANFIKNFCDHELSDDELRDFNVDECKVKSLANKLFGSIFSQSQPQESPESKFHRLWALKEKNWTKLTSKEISVCEANLRRISAPLFSQKEREQATQEVARHEYLQSHKINISGLNIKDDDELRLEAQLIINGKVRIDRDGKIIKNGNPIADDDVIEIQLAPVSKGDSKQLQLFVMMPNSWKLKNSEDTHLWGNRSGRSFREFCPGENSFFYHNTAVFSIRISEEGSKKEGPSRSASKAEPSSQSSYARAPKAEPSAQGSRAREPRPSHEPPPPSKSQQAKTSAPSQPEGPTPIEVLQFYREKVSGATMNNPYSLLGLASSATNDEIRKEWRKLVFQFHPDKNINNVLLAEGATKLLNEAYDKIKKARGIS